ncbi:MAG TPA: phosphatase PAP2 family protein [Thermoanaerobaculia bacterium]
MREFLRRRLSREEAVGLSFTISFLACAALAGLLGWLAHDIHEERGQPGPFDVRLSQSLIARRSPPLTAAMIGVTFTGDHRFLLVATPLVMAALWSARRHVSALLFAGSVVGGFGLSSLLKITLTRARPDRWGAIVTEATYSFPSGHTVMTTVFFGGLAAIVFHLTRRPLPRVVAVLAAATIVFAVAASRVYLGAHWPTDTLAGMLTGLVWVVVFSATTEAVERAKARRKPAG